MELFRGRLIDHIHLRAKDLGKTKAFYKAALGALDIPVNEDDTHLQADELWIDALGKDQASASHVHLAFQAVNREMVERFHKAGLEAGGKDNGKPGERPYHPGYYGAFLTDPDGNNIEAVYHGPAKRSAEAVTLEFKKPG
ncbi:MAG: VOC family protein [Alphaproteobacteria bacterium]|nr:MAG: VOC family protein [Alphaproteobacteria bacterium]